MDGKRKTQHVRRSVSVAGGRYVERCRGAERGRRGLEEQDEDELNFSFVVDFFVALRDGGNSLVLDLGGGRYFLICKDSVVTHVPRCFVEN